MGASYADLLEQLIKVRDGQYRSDPEYNEAILDALTFSVCRLLEKLRDAEDARGE